MRGIFGIGNAFEQDVLNMRPGSIVRLDPSQRIAMQQQAALYQHGLAQASDLHLRQMVSQATMYQQAAMQNAYKPAPLPPYRDSATFKEGAELGQKMAERIAFWKGFLGPLAAPFLARIAEPLDNLCEHMEARLAAYPAPSGD